MKNKTIKIKQLNISEELKQHYRMVDFIVALVGEGTPEDNSCQNKK